MISYLRRSRENDVNPRRINVFAITEANGEGMR